MVRRFSFAAVTVAAMAVAFVSGAVVTPTDAKSVEDKKPDTAKPAVVIGHKTAVFNMAAVMRDFNQAKYRVWLLNAKRAELSKKLQALRQEYAELQQAVQQAGNGQPPQGDKAKRVLALARKIEDEDREINKQLNDAASAIIADLHDMIKEAVTRTAERDGFQLVLSYPDAVTPEERNSPYIKELKLKPPAAQPFYHVPEIDITARVVAALNEKHPPLDPETQEPVDVSKLPAPGAPAPLPKVRP